MNKFDPARTSNQRSWWYQPELTFVTLCVVGFYFIRLEALPVCGEEGRWARAATQMIETGDWIVTRQQGEVFPERPPMSSWAMAICGLLRGGVDDLAVRIPSVLAILLTTWCIYAYSRAFLSRVGSMASSLVYATMGQVLQLGRMGESEALFTLFVSASMLGWHTGYVRRWPQVSVWILGYSLAALAALVKGPQAPAYFMAVTWAFLAINRKWRWVVGLPHLAGICVFLILVGAWQIPFLLATDSTSAAATWMGLAGDRFLLNGMLTHLVVFPFDIFCCLLPWSPLLLLLLYPSVRQSLLDYRTGSMVVFLTCSLVVTFPTVWFASLGEPRYLMPLYPGMAVLIGLIIERCIHARELSRLWEAWQTTLIGFAITAAIIGTIILCSTFLPWHGLSRIRQPTVFSLFFALAAVITATALVWAHRHPAPLRSQIAVALFGGFTGLFYSGVVVNMHAGAWNNPRPSVASIRRQMPEPERLVSFGAIDHRFAYYYELQIAQCVWPTSLKDVPSDVRYFCFNRLRGDTAEWHKIGRGRRWHKATGTLPFDWEEVAVVCCDRKITRDPDRLVVIGRRILSNTANVGARPSRRKALK